MPAEIRTKKGKLVGSFRSLEDAQQYVKDNNLEQVFQEPELPELVVRPKRGLLEQGAANFENTFGVSVKDAASMLPFVGEAIDTHDAYQAIKDRDYLTAGLIGAGYLIPNIIEKPAKALYRGIKRAAKRAYTTPTKVLGNRSLRSNLKVFTGRNVKGGERYTNFDKGVRNRLESAYPDYTFDVHHDRIKADSKKGTMDSENDVFSFTDPITGIRHDGKKTNFRNTYRMFSVNAHDSYPVITTRRGTNVISTPIGKSLQEPISQYEQSINRLIGNNAHIAGSTPVYGRGYVLGSPNDLELVSTKRRFPSVVSSLEGSSVAPHGNFGYDMYSRYGIGGNPVTTHIVNENANGKAVGPIAHEYYSLLYPEEYRKLTEAAIDEGFAKGKRITLDDIELPVSAEELYSSITPDIQERKLLKDLFISDKDKHVSRAFQMLTSDNKNVRDKAVQSMREAIGHHFGKDYKLVSETYPNISFNDVEANEQFLKSINLPTEYAKDPDIMRNIVDRWHIAETTQSRNTFVRKGDQVYLPDRPTMERAARTIYAPNNGNVSGIGGNTIINSGAGGLGGDFAHIMQQRLTLYPEEINTPLDLINQENRLANIDNSIYNAFNDTENTLRLKRLSEAEGIAKHRSLAEEHDIPAYYGAPYGEGRYVGNLVEPINVRTYPIKGGGRGIRPEVGGTGIPRNLETFHENYIEYPDLDDVNPNIRSLAKDLLDEAVNTGRIYGDWDAWHSKVRKANRNLDKAKERAKVGTVAIGGGLLGAGTIAVLRNNAYTDIKDLSDEDLESAYNYMVQYQDDDDVKSDLAEIIAERNRRNKHKHGGRITLE